MTNTETAAIDRSARRLAADLERDIAADNEHLCATGSGLIPQCPWCEGSGVDGDERCTSCEGTGRATCECGEPALRYDVDLNGIPGYQKEPRCYRCCRQIVGLVGP